MAMSQANRPLRATLGSVDPEGMLVTRFIGTETMSRLYQFTLEIVAPADAPLKFADVLGKPALVEIDQAAEQTRFFHGIVNRFSQGVKNNKFISYRAEIVPVLWLMTKQTRSRVFQPITTKDLLPAVIGKLYSARMTELKAKYFTRNHTVQYRESDFSFLSRLMEEEGIYYYFTHTKDGQELVLADNKKGHDVVPADMPLRFQDDGLETPSEGRITQWEKVQQLRFGAVDYSDHTFEMPGHDLNFIAFPLDNVKAGTVEHNLGLGDMKDFGLVEHPAGYARFRDTVNPGGADQKDDLEHVFEDNGRFTDIRMEEEQVKSLEIEAVSTYNRLTAGHKFTLKDHFDADGDYVLTRVTHRASCGIGDSGEAVDFKYENDFTCIPFELPFRPARATPKPFVQGTQTAVVVGGEGEEIEPDKYGRVKVLFRWDPEGNRGLDSSCWVRVAQFWAGRQWGAQFIPRVGDEVIVAFEGGDPDQPIIIGSVYNADNMPIYKLPENKTQSGIKTHSSKDAPTSSFNELRFEDKKGAEQFVIHAEKDMITSVENNHSVSVGSVNTTAGSENNTIKGKGDPKKSGTSTTAIFGDTTVTIEAGAYKLDAVAGKMDINAGGPHLHMTTPKEFKITVGGAAFIKITPDTITLDAKHIVINGSADIKVKTPDLDSSGAKTNIHGDTITITGNTSVTADGKGSATYQSSTGPLIATGATTATFGVGSSNVKCDAGTTTVTANGPTTVKGSVVKVNC